MKFSYIYLFIIFTLAFSPIQADETNHRFSFHPKMSSKMPSHTGSLSGLIGGGWMIAGGFDAKGKLDPHIYLKPDGLSSGDSWITHAWNEPKAWAASVDHNGGVIVIGGMSAFGLCNTVSSLQLEKSTIKTKSLPDLPVKLAMAGAGIVDHNLYVFGGISEESPPTVNRGLFSLDLNDISKPWIHLGESDHAARLSPAVVPLFGELHVFGGFELIEQGENVLAKPLDRTDGYRPKPIDGKTTTGWSSYSPSPFAFAGASVVATGQCHALIVGGISEDRDFDFPHFKSKAHPNKKSAIFHSITDTWVVDADMPIDSFDAKGVTIEGDHALIGGELNAPVEIQLHRVVRTLGVLDYMVMLVFFIAMALIGCHFAKKQTGSDEFALGGRNVKWWAAGISMFATGASSISFMAIPAIVFTSNLIWLGPILITAPFIYYLMGYVFFPLIRRLNLTSTYAYLEMRFGPTLRYVASAQSVALQLLGRMSVVMLLPSMAITAVTGLNVYLSVALMGLLTTIYTTIGGFEAVIWTDVIQGFLMLGGMIVMIFIAIDQLDGSMNEFITTSQNYQRFDLFIWEWNYTIPMTLVFVISTIFANLAITSDQCTIQRVLASPLKDVRKLNGMFVLCAVTIALVCQVCGVALFSYFHAHPEVLDPAMKNDQLVPLFVVQTLPTGVAGLIIAALFAASMSTLSSSMNSVATVACEDWYTKIRPQSTDRQRLLFMKTASLIVGVIGTSSALFMAGMQITSMFETWNVILSLIGGGFIGIYILGMFTTRANSIGVSAGAIASIVITLWVKNNTPLHWTFYSPVAVTSCISIGYLVSLLFPISAKDLKGLTIFTASDKR
jgi:SSS family transporter